MNTFLISHFVKSTALVCVPDRRDKGVPDEPQLRVEPEGDDNSPKKQDASRDEHNPSRHRMSLCPGLYKLGGRHAGYESLNLRTSEKSLPLTRGSFEACLKSQDNEKEWAKNARGVQ